MKPLREPIAHDLATVHVLAVDRARFDGPYHHHEALELTLIRAGSGVRVIGGEAASFAAGDLVLVPPKVPHVWWSRGAPGASSALVLHLALPPTLLALPELRALASMFDGQARPAALHGRLHDAVAEEMHALAGCHGLERLGRALALLGRIVSARAGVTGLAAASRGAALEGDDTRLGRLLGWIHRAHAQPLSVAEAARRLSVAPVSFSRAFHRRVGRPFTVYVNDVRIAQACLLLRDARWPIAEIARRCGFPTLGHFHRQLARRTGLGPRAYQQQFARQP
jgi:AraC-like DNA-binding protein